MIRSSRFPQLAPPLPGCASLPYCGRTLLGRPARSLASWPFPVADIRDPASSLTCSQEARKSQASHPAPPAPPRRSPVRLAATVIRGSGPFMEPWPFLAERGRRSDGRRAKSRRSVRRDAHDGPSAVRADQGDRRSVGNARSSSRIEGVERPTYFVRGAGVCNLGCAAPNGDPEKRIV